jgi:hypothetical protein
MNTKEVDNSKNVAEQIDECHALFVTHFRELEELTLELLISEAKPQAPILVPRSDSAVDRMMVGARPIEWDETCRMFRVVFDRRHMIFYSVLNECYGRYPEPPEQFEGKRFRVFSRSHLLDFIKRTTHASDGYPGTLLHFQIAAENHVIDAITTAHPLVSILASPQQRLAALGGTQPYLEAAPRRRPNF